MIRMDVSSSVVSYTAAEPDLCPCLKKVIRLLQYILDLSNNTATFCATKVAVLMKAKFNLFLLEFLHTLLNKYSKVTFWQKSILRAIWRVMDTFRCLFGTISKNWSPMLFPSFIIPHAGRYILIFVLILFLCEMPARQF